MFIDTHCHLDFAIFNKKLKSLINDCNNIGVKHFINPGTQKSTWMNLISLNKQFKNIHICFGLHPIFIEKHNTNDLNILEEYTYKNETKIIGEIGVDKRIKYFDKQLSLFSAQLEIAKNLEKRVILHSVKSHNEIIKTIKNVKYKNGGIIHAFNGDYITAKKYIEMGFKLGIGGIISYPESKLKKSIKKISHKDIVLETDSPDMRLYDSDSNINTPLSIIRIFQILSDIYQINPDILKKQIYNTSLEFI